MGRKVSEKGKVIRGWISRNPDGKFKDFEQAHPGLTTGAYFSNAKSRLNNPGKRTPVRPERTVLKKVVSEPMHPVPAPPPKPLPPPKPEPEAQPVRASVKHASDAGLILEAAVKVWISKDSTMIQLRTITNSIINEYRYIQTKIKE